MILSKHKQTECKFIVIFMCYLSLGVCLLVFCLFWKMGGGGIVFSYNLYDDLLCIVYIFVSTHCCLGDESRTEADVMFLMDGSQSMSSYNWMMSTHFAANFLDALEVRPDFVHTGAMIADTFRGDEVGISPFKTR